MSYNKQILILLKQNKIKIESILSVWNNTEDPNLIEVCIIKYNALLKEQNYLIGEVKKCG